MAGDICANVHTVAFPGGEIRGKLELSKRQGRCFGDDDEDHDNKNENENQNDNHDHQALTSAVYSRIPSDQRGNEGARSSNAMRPRTLVQFHSH